MKCFGKAVRSSGFTSAVVGLFVLAGMFCGVGRAHAVSQIQTRYYTIVYEPSGEYVAGEIARFCDDIYEKLMSRYKAFNGDPRVTCIVTDEADFANGYAQYFQNTITIYATTMDFELRGQSNWLRNVFVHEMTHMIALKQAAKGPINFIMLGAGKYDENPDFDISLALYHLSQPAWFSEGTAQVGAESFGAERWDTHRDMLLRSAWYDSSLLDLDDMSVLSGKKGMDAELVYNQGYSLSRYIKETYGYDKLVRLNNVWTWTDFNTTVEKVLGIKASRLYADWRASLDRTYGDFRARVFTEGEKVADEGTTDYRPVVSPDGRYLVWLSNRGRDYAITDLMLRDISTGKTRKITERVDSRASWSHDSGKLVYAKRPSPGSLYYDIFIYDVQSGVEERVSKNLRSRDPAFSPGDSLIVFVRNEGGNNAIGIINVDGTGQRYISATRDGTQFYTPSFSPDGSRVLFSLFRQDRDRDIATVNAGCRSYRYGWDRADSTSGFSDSTAFACDSEFRVLLGSRHDERDPRFLPDGSGIVYSSDRTGVFNLYLLDFSTGRTRRVTDTVGGAFCPSPGPNQSIWYAGYRSGDFSIYRLDEPAPLEDVLPVNESRSYLTQLPGFDLPGNFSVQPYRTRRILDAIVPTVTVGPSFIGSRFGLNVLNVGAQAYISDVLGQDALMLGGSVGKNMKEDVSLNNEFQFFYQRRMAPLTSSGYSHAPSLFVGASRTVINNHIGRFEGTADSLYYADVAGTPFRNVLHDINYRYTVADLYRDEFRRYRAGVQFPLAPRHFLLFEASYRQYYETLRRQEKLMDSSTFVHNGVDVTDQVPGARRTQTAETAYFTDMQYFRSGEFGASYIYSRQTPAADTDISPKGTTLFLQFKHLIADVTDSLVTQPSLFVPTGMALDANGNLVFQYGTYQPDDLLDVFRPRKRTRDINEYTMIYDGNYRLPFLRHDFGSLLYAGYRDVRLPNSRKGEGSGYDWPIKYYLGGEHTLSGYPYFAFWGSKVFFGRLTYTMPLRDEIGWNLGGLHLQRLYGSAFFEAGSTWNFAKVSMDRLRAASIKRDVGIELRLKTVWFYRLDALAYAKVAWPLDDMGGSPYKNDARRFYFGLRM